MSDNEEEKSPGVKEEPVPFSEYQDWRADEARERNRKRIREANRRDREICDHSRKSPEISSFVSSAIQIIEESWTRSKKKRGLEVRGISGTGEHSWKT